MGRRCDFSVYKYGSDYCLKTDEKVSSAVFDQYCSSWDFDDCPFFKGESSSGGCYLTSACIRAKGLPDDCDELTTLRAFRDGWLKKQSYGKSEICEYYSVAPRIVDAIDSLPDSTDIWCNLYNSLIVPCVQMIKNEDYTGAHDLYLKTSRNLSLKYLQQ